MYQLAGSNVVVAGCWRPSKRAQFGLGLGFSTGGPLLSRRHVCVCPPQAYFSSCACASAVMSFSSLLLPPGAVAKAAPLLSAVAGGVCCCVGGVSGDTLIFSPPALHASMVANTG